MEVGEGEGNERKGRRKYKVTFSMKRIPTFLQSLRQSRRSLVSLASPLKVESIFSFDVARNK